MTNSYVQVATDGSGKKIRNVQQTVDANVVQVQVTAQGDPNDPAAVAAVSGSLPAADAYAVVVRTPRASFDSGLVTVPDSDDEVTDADTWVTGILLTNLTDELQTFTLKNDLGAYYMKNAILQPNETKWVPLGGVKFEGGIHWQAGAADVINAQIVGEQ